MDCRTLQARTLDSGEGDWTESMRPENMKTWDEGKDDMDMTVGGILVASREQQAFTTGATRSADSDKIDFEGHIHPEVLAIFGDYMHAHRVQRNGETRASDNWQLGIPIYKYTKSLIRHGLEFWRMWRGYPVMNVDSKTRFTFRDVLCALLFNVQGLILEMHRADLLTAEHISVTERHRLENL